MMFVRLDCLIRLNGKILKLRASTCWYFVCALSYANQHETGGFVPKSVTASLWSSSREPRFQHREHVRELLEHGFFEDVGGSYRIHDYFDYQPSPNKLESRRLADRERQRRRRERMLAEEEAERRWRCDGRDPQRSTTDPAWAPDHPQISAGLVDRELHRMWTPSAEQSHDFVCTSTTEVREFASFSASGHGVTTCGSFDQPEPKQEQNFKSSQSDRPQGLEDRFVSGIQAAAAQLGWGRLPAAIVDQFAALEPAVTINELSAVQRLVAGKGTHGTGQVRSPALYALQVLRNRRLQAAAGQRQGASGRKLGARIGRRQRHEEEALYRGLHAALTGSHWRLGLTLKNVEALHAVGVETVAQFELRAHELDEEERQTGAPASWASLLEAAKGRQR